jgi:hypothetical protein
MKSRGSNATATQQKLDESFTETGQKKTTDISEGTVGGESLVACHLILVFRTAALPGAGDGISFHEQQLHVLHTLLVFAAHMCLQQSTPALTKTNQTLDHCNNNVSILMPPHAKTLKQTAKFQTTAGEIFVVPKTHTTVF